MSQIPEEVVQQVVGEVSSKMQDPSYAQIAIGSFAQAHPDVGRFITAHLDELGSGEAPIFHAILGIARGFGLRVVAEGVETEEQMRVLARDVRCIAQGYLVAPPRPVEELDELLERTDLPWSRWSEG